MDSFIDLLNLQPESEILEVIKKNVISKTIVKSSIVQRHGETVSKAYFVKKGLLRSYTIDENGKEHIFMFAPEGWVVSDIESQVNDSPAELFIDALEDSEVDVIDIALISDLHFQAETVQNSVYKLIKRVGVLQRRVIMLMSSPAIKRYEHFIETYPQIINRVPQRMIASYLGITPEALSRLRREIAKRK